MITAIRTRWSVPQGYRDVLRVGMPLVAGMLSSTVMQFTDRLFLSHYSVTSIAAALPAAMAALALQLPFVGVCGYAAVIIAHYVGAARHKEVGSALWQGIWTALLAAMILGVAWPLAEPLFSWTGHTPAVQAEEVIYFRILMLGSVFFLLGAAIGSFFVGRGHTRPVLVANFASAVLNIPLDYALIFGKWGLPELGIAGAALATVIGWAFCAVILAVGVFRKDNNKTYHVFRAWKFKFEPFFRLLRFGGPNGVNLFMEVAGFAWFSFEVGKLGETAQAASNIALSINTLSFTPMLGLNMAVSALVGQAMGRAKPGEAARAAISALHISLAYMLPVCLIFFLCAGPLMDVFRPGDAGADYAAIRATGVVLIYYIAVYSLVDSCNIVFLGTLKGAGDTAFVMLILGGAGIFLLVVPILALKLAGAVSLHSLWVVLTTYVMGMALCAYLRFRQNRWRTMRVIGE